MGQNFYQRDVRNLRFVLNDQPDADKILTYDANNGRYFFSGAAVRVLRKWFERLIGLMGWRFLTN